MRSEKASKAAAVEFEKKRELTRNLTTIIGRIRRALNSLKPLPKELLHYERYYDQSVKYVVSIGDLTGASSPSITELERRIEECTRKYTNLQKHLPVIAAPVPVRAPNNAPNNAPIDRYFFIRAFALIVFAYFMVQIMIVASLTVDAMKERMPEKQPQFGPQLLPLISAALSILGNLVYAWNPRDFDLRMAGLLMRVTAIIGGLGGMWHQLKNSNGWPTEAQDEVNLATLPQNVFDILAEVPDVTRMWGSCFAIISAFSGSTFGAEPVAMPRGRRIRALQPVGNPQQLQQPPQNITAAPSVAAGEASRPVAT